MESTPLSELLVAVHVRRSSTHIMNTLGTSSAASVTTSLYCRTNDTIFELESDIDEYVATEDALDIDGYGGDRNAEGDEFELHTNSNETEYSVEDDAITGEGNVEKGYNKKFLKVTARGSMETIGEIDVNNSTSFEGVKIPSTLDDYVP